MIVKQCHYFMKNQLLVHENPRYVVSISSLDAVAVIKVT